MCIQISHQVKQFRTGFYRSETGNDGCPSLWNQAKKIKTVWKKSFTLSFSGLICQVCVTEEIPPEAVVLVTIDSYVYPVRNWVESCMVLPYAFGDKSEYMHPVGGPYYPKLLG